MSARLVLGLLLLLAGNVSAREVLYWFQYDMRPFYIQDGPYAGEGFTEIADRLIRKELPQYEHKVIWGNLARMLQLLRSGENVVCSNLLRNAERESLLTISKNYRQIVLVQELIVPADRAAALEPYRDKNGAIDLERVLQEGKLTGLLPAGRSYGAILDPLLGKYLGQKNLESRHAQSNSIYGILQMLNARRADFTIAYPTEVTYEYRLRNSGEQPGEKPASGEFASFRIAGMPEFVNGYAMGPKTPWGEKVIGEIDAAIRRLRFKPEFVRPTLEWNEGDARRRLEQLYRNAREQEARKP